MKRDGFGHEKPNEGKSNDWITPRWLIDAIGYGFFDLDPCASTSQPWSCARDAFTVEQDGLAHDWWGNVWLNPPYGPHTKVWVARLAKHGKGIALIYARLETRLWQKNIFPTAIGYLFPAKRIQFYLPDGSKPKSGSTAPSALIAWGKANADKLRCLVETGVIPGAYFDEARV